MGNDISWVMIYVETKHLKYAYHTRTLVRK